MTPEHPDTLDAAFDELDRAMPPFWSLGTIVMVTPSPGRVWRASVVGHHGARHSEDGATRAAAVLALAGWLRREFSRRGHETPQGWLCPEGYAIELRDPPSRCRSCGAEIAWAITPAGKKAPLNRDGSSHFANCPQAGTWRRKA